MSGQDLSVESLYRANQPTLTGLLKKQPKYFKVTEIPLIEPDGDGRFLFIRVTREGYPTFEVCKLLSKLFGLTNNCIGYAGLKDKVALVEQIFSIRLEEDALPEVEKSFEGYKTKALNELEFNIELFYPEDFKRSLNSKKLRGGLLRGNKFDIIIANVKPQEEGTNLEATYAKLKQNAEELKSFPNYFGSQRVGVNGKAAKEGLKKFEVVQKFVETAKRDDIPLTKKNFRRFLRKRPRSGDNKNIIFKFDSFGASQKFSAFQAAIFNITLSQRLKEGKYNIDIGDSVMSQYGGKTTVHKHNDPNESQTLLTFALPMIGPRALATDQQKSILDSYKFSQEIFKVVGLDGSYRPGLIDTSSTQLTLQLINESEDIPDKDLPALNLRFQLPKGAFATNLLAEFFTFVTEE